MEYIARDIKLKLNEMSGSDSDIEFSLLKKINIDPKLIKNFKIIRRSLDSRFHESKGIFYVYTFTFSSEKRISNKYISENNDKDISFDIDTQKYSSLNDRKFVIVGSGPSGLFAALRLLDYGIAPLIIEMGKDVKERADDIDKINKGEGINTLSNIQFGLGGAGTFSDGKLMSRVKSSYIPYISDTFIKFGASNDISYMSKPHVGTDRLRNIVANIKTYLINHGADIMFDSKLTDLTLKNNKVSSIIINNQTELECDYLVLGLGNAARDTFELLNNKNIAIEQKPISVGVRVEHHQDTINNYIYGKYKNDRYLKPAELSLTYKDSETGRGVYSFCNCPGGYVINSSTEVGGICINGMSYSQRDGDNSNTAIVVNINKEDYSDAHPLAGVYYQRSIERATFVSGGENGFVPVSSIGNYLKENDIFCDVSPTVAPGVLYTELESCFPEYINIALKNTLKYYSENIPGFGNGIITACETRTSSPIRILRDKEHFNCLNINNMFPIGEGSGYAGGITSSAIDGVKCIDAIMINNI